ncbi:MAG TPA: ribose 5-phosphate isomerase B [Anaerolineaceae bacterium]|nr:ribose 5-phosphate isomerase B [Anaerolineaceae bacterium]
MRIAIACDHAGFDIKDDIVLEVQRLGHDVIDLGTYNQEPVDYPDYAKKACDAILQGQAERGIVLCGSGVGAAIAANKIKGIYACVCHDTYSAHQGVEHDNMNLLTMGARIIGVELAREIVRNFLQAKFSDEERHHRRFEKIRAIENNR